MTDVFVSAILTIKSKSRKSLFRRAANFQNFATYLPDKGKIEKVAKSIEAKGFKILAKGDFSLSIAAPLSKFEKTLGIKPVKLPIGKRFKMADVLAIESQTVDPSQDAA